MNIDEKIKTVSIVAHIDHGKSTLCDCILRLCNVDVRSERLLDAHHIEQSRGVTICNHYVNLQYRDRKFNLIDTPGHYDFRRFVEVAIDNSDIVCMMIDGSKGVQAQTLTYCRLAKANGKIIIPIINKIDLPESINHISSIAQFFKQYTNEKIHYVSARNDQGIIDILEHIHNIEISYGSISSCVTVLGTAYEKYSGVILLVKVGVNELKIDDYIILSRKKHRIRKIMICTPSLVERESVIYGEICYIDIGLEKDRIDFDMFSIGTHLQLKENCCNCKIKSYQEISIVYQSIYPVGSSSFDDLKNAIAKCKLYDHSVKIELEYNDLLLQGYRCGFLGEFHNEVFLQRLKIDERVSFIKIQSAMPYMYNDKIITSISRATLGANYVKALSSFRAPFCLFFIYIPLNYYDRIMSNVINAKYCEILDVQVQEDYMYILVRAVLSFILLGVAKKVKENTNGYGSITVEKIDFDRTKLELVEFIVNRNLIPSLSFVDAEGIGEIRGREICDFISTNMRRQQYNIIIQLNVNSRIVHREEIKQFRKDVISKCYGGDRTRKNKLLKNQKEGKKRLISRNSRDQIDQEILKIFQQKEN